MTTIYINMGSTVNQASAPWTDNFFTSANSMSTGVIKADLLDDTQSTTGIGFSNITAYSGTSGSGGVATVGAGNFPEEVLDRAWGSDSEGTSRLTGLTNGDSYSIEVAGHNAGDTTKDTDFTIGIDSTTYQNSGTTTPNTPLIFTGTVSGTTLDIDPAAVSINGFMNGLIITITAPTGPTITSTDPTTLVQGETFENTGTDLDTATTAGIELIDESYELSLTIDAQTATTLDQVADLGTPTSTTPVASLPVVADVMAAGTTAYTWNVWADDGSAKGVLAVSLVGPANTTTTQVMIATSNTTEGESLVAPSIVTTLEDDFQYTGPTVQSGVTITYNADGTVSTSPANQITIDLEGWAPSTGQRSLTRVTITGTVISLGTALTRDITSQLTSALTTDTTG